MCHQAWSWSALRSGAAVQNRRPLGGGHFLKSVPSAHRKEPPSNAAQGAHRNEREADERSPEAYEGCGSTIDIDSASGAVGECARKLSPRLPGALLCSPKASLKGTKGSHFRCPSSMVPWQLSQGQLGLTNSRGPAAGIHTSQGLVSNKKTSI